MLNGISSAFQGTQNYDVHSGATARKKKLNNGENK